MANGDFKWYPTAAQPVIGQSTRYDDIWFTSPEEGWAVNAAGEIRHTTDGGRNWDLQYQMPLESPKTLSGWSVTPETPGS